MQHCYEGSQRTTAARAGRLHRRRRLTLLRMLWSLPLPLLLLLRLRRWLLLVPVLLLPPVLRCWCCHHSSGMLLLLLVMLLLLLLLLGLFLLLALAALLAAAAAAAADRRCIQLRQQCRHGRIRLLLPLLQLPLAAGPLLPRAPASPRSRMLLPLPHALPLLQAPQRLCCPRVSLLGGRLQLVDWLCIQAGRAGQGWRVEIALHPWAEQVGMRRQQCRWWYCTINPAVPCSTHLHWVVLGLRVHVESVGPMQAQHCMGHSNGRQAESKADRRAGRQPSGCASALHCQEALQPDVQSTWINSRQAWVDCKH